MSTAAALAWLTAQLPSTLRCVVMRLSGHDIGKRVRIGRGTRIVGRRIRIADGVVLGRSVHVVGESICIEAEVRIGDNTRIGARNISIGRDSLITSDVHIGGFHHPESGFIMGSNSIVMYNTYIDTTRTVHIGSHVGIGGHCLLFTHSSWMNRYLGYPVKFASLIIGDGAWLPWRVFVLPGVRIGKGSLVGADSLVLAEIPERVFAAGSPAKVIRPLEAKPVDDAARMAITVEIMREFADVLQMRGYDVRSDGSRVEVRDSKGSTKKIILNEQSTVSNKDFDSDCLVVSVQEISFSERQALWNRNTFWIDIQSFERAPINSEIARQLCAVFLRHGVRFNQAF